MEKCSRFVIVAMAFVGVAIAQTQINEMRPAAGDVSIGISMVKGSVDVRAWDQPAVEVTGKLNSDSDRLELTGTEDQLSVHVVNPNRKPKEANLVIHVPYGASVQVDCTSAAIGVEGVEGDLDLRTVSGKIDAAGTGGRVRVETVSGSIDVEGRPLSVEAKTVSGKLDILAASDTPLRTSPDAARSVRTSMERIGASTVSGNIDIESINLTLLECETVSGSIDYIGALAPDGEADLETHSGRIDLQLPAGTPVSLDLNTFSGGIKSDFGGAVDSRSVGPGHSLEFAGGAGSARIHASAFSGSISVRHR